jgi:hypothetical protein
MAQPQVAYFDNGGLDGITVAIDVTLDKLPLTSQSTRPPIPEEYMDRLESLLGDGRATVTFGLDVKTNEDFGNAAGCTVYVKLTCDQSEEKVNETRLIAQELAQHFVKEGQQHAQRILDEARGKVPDSEPEPKPTESKKPSLKTPLRKPVPKKAESEKDPEPRSQSSPSKKPLSLKGKPSFRR